MADDTRQAKDGDTVQVHYTGTLDDGEKFDSSHDHGTPLSFTVGSGQVISGFDSGVRGLVVGESRKVRMEADDAYGQPDERLVANFPKDQAPEGLKPGDQVQVGDRPAVVTAVSDTEVTVDGNHPLAGKALNFEIELVAFG